MLKTCGRSVCSRPLSGTPLAVNPMNGKSNARLTPGESRPLTKCGSSELASPE